jgi:parvulin-like peptidyl-prolyl isomerase
MLFEPEIIIEFLKREVQLKEVCRKILCRQVIDRAAQERGITIAPEEIQIEADRQRHQRRLESAAATFAWLQDQMITPDEWEAGIRDSLISQKLATALFTDEVGKYFTEHRLDFEQILLYKIVVPYEQLAQEIFYQVEESEISFYEAAHLYDIDERRRLQCGYEGKLYRWSLKPEIAAIIFSARAGEIITPFQTDQGYELLMVEEFISAELTPEIAQKITHQLFGEWLESELNYAIHQNELPTDLGSP